MREIPISSTRITLSERIAVDRVLRSGFLAQGNIVREFEESFAEIAGVPHAIATNSGTSALHLSMLALGLGVGDEVIVPSFTFAATANSVALTGAKPVFVDIEPEYFSIDPASVEKAITSRTKAVVAVHMFGHPARLDRLVEICKKHGLYLVEDAAQAHAAKFLDIPIGSWGDLAAFSFYPTKNMTTGEGGIVTTRNSEFADKIRLLRNQGMKERYVHEVVGLNNRMTEFSAAIGIGQLKKLDRATARRKKNAKYLTDGIKGVDTPKIYSQASHVFHQYTVRVTGGKRDRFVEELRSRGIGAQVYYPRPVHEQPAYKVPITLPETSLACSEVVSIPVHPNLSKRDLKQIVATVNLVAKLVLN